jgi:hypothetical protein
MFAASGGSNTIVQMQIENWEASGLPRLIEVVIKPCGYFGGKVGDLAQVALVEPSPRGLPKSEVMWQN